MPMAMGTFGESSPADTVSCEGRDGAVAARGEYAEGSEIPLALGDLTEEEEIFDPVRLGAGAGGAAEGSEIPLALGDLTEERRAIFDPVRLGAGVRGVAATSGALDRPPD